PSRTRFRARWPLRHRKPPALGRLLGRPSRRDHQGGILDSTVPVIAIVLPIAALSTAEWSQVIDQLDRVEIFRLLIAQGSLNPQPDRRAVAYRQRLVVETIAEDRLGMIGIHQIRAGIIENIAR